MKPPVIKDVVERGMCIGCGICAALCPKGVLSMRFNEQGEYRPIGECEKECGICLSVCPFTSNEDEDTIGTTLFGENGIIHHSPHAGYYLDSFVCHSEEHRPTSSSGGIGTWLLETVLKRDIVDHVICVRPTGNPDKLFSFDIVDDPETLRSCSGSAYYPVEMSRVIRSVIDNPGRYAITCVPCFAKAIRLAQMRNPKLRDRMVLVIGLTCGQMKSRHYTDHLLTMTGIRERPSSVRYRGKDMDRDANDYFFSSERSGPRLYWKEGMSVPWSDRWFAPQACNYCDDIFAECADVNVMDAWLPEYSSDPRGNSLMIVRSPVIMDILNDHGDDVKIEQLPIERVVRSQRGVVRFKRDDLSIRLHRTMVKGGYVPVKRKEAKRTWNPLKAVEVSALMDMQERSRDLSAELPECYSEEAHVELRKELGPMVRRYNRIRKVNRIFSLPLRGMRMMSRRILDGDR